MNKAFTLIETIIILFILTIMLNLLTSLVSFDQKIEQNISLIEGEA